MAIEKLAIILSILAFFIPLLFCLLSLGIDKQCTEDQAQKALLFWRRIEKVSIAAFLILIILSLSIDSVADHFICVTYIIATITSTYSWRIHTWQCRKQITTPEIGDLS